MAKVKIPFIGPSYTERSVNFDCQRSVNLYPVKGDSGDAKSVAGLQGTPGKSIFCTLPTSRGRGGREVLGRAFEVFGNTLYEIFTDKTYVSRGTLVTDTGFVSCSDNGLQLCVVDGPNGYILDLTTNTFTQITDPYFLGAVNVIFIDGYFMFNKPDSGIYYISALYDGLTGDPLDFASAEGSPDALIGIAAVHKEVWLFGSKTIEIATDTGAADFPFARIPGAFIEYGCAAPYSIATTANTVFWLGQDAYGQGVVWMAQGYQPQRISTYAVEYAIQQYGDISDAISYTYQEDGHYFLVINFTNANTSWVYDINLGAWHERAAYSNNLGQFIRDSGQNHIFAFNKHLVADYQNGNLYEQSLNIFTDNGSVIRRMRTAQHLAQNLDYMYYNSLQIDMETGVGLSTGQIYDTDPQLMLQWSDDGGHVFSNEHWRSAGKLGSFKWRALWRRLGRSRDRVFKLVITASCKIFLIAAWADIDQGTN